MQFAPIDPHANLGFTVGLNKDVLAPCDASLTRVGGVDRSLQFCMDRDLFIRLANQPALQEEFQPSVRLIFASMNVPRAQPCLM